MKPAYNWSGKTILMVEDDDTSFIYVSETIKSFNPIVTRCKSGLVAFFNCMNYPMPDMVIMDIRLPEMSGYDSSRLIKKFRPGIRILALTACAMQDEKRRCLVSGCDFYLTKPVLPLDLINTIENILNHPKIDMANEFVQSYR